MSEAIILGLITIGGGAIGNYAAQWLREKNETKRGAVQVSGEVHKADLESDAQFMERLIKRVEHLEARQLETEKIVREQDGKISDLKLMLERVGNEYETLRKLQRRVARQLREGKSIDEDTLSEMENAPIFARVLAGAESARPLPEAANGA